MIESPPQPQIHHQPEFQRLSSSCDVGSAAQLLRKARHTLQHKTSCLPALTGPEPWPTRAPSTAPQPLFAAHHHCTRCLAACLPLAFLTACMPCGMCLTNVQAPRVFQHVPVLSTTSRQDRPSPRPSGFPRCCHCLASALSSFIGATIYGSWAGDTAHSLLQPCLSRPYDSLG